MIQNPKDKLIRIQLAALKKLIRLSVPQITFSGGSSFAKTLWSSVGKKNFFILEQLALAAVPTVKTGETTFTLRYWEIFTPTYSWMM